MALSTVNAPSDDSGQDGSGGTGSLAWANGTPLSRAAKRGAGPVYDVRLLEALRRISALERERLQANRALNGVIAHSLELESRLADTQATLEHANAAFASYVRAEIAHLTAENDDIARRLALLQKSIFWRIGVFVRSARARLRQRA